MGGHGGLNILPQKRWNVYNFDNRERVRKDEEAAAKKEADEQRLARQRDSEFRLEKLREIAHAKRLAEDGGAESGSEPGEEPAASVNVVKVEHINLFKEVEERPVERASRNGERKGREEGRHKKDKTKEELAADASDEQYRFVYGSHGKGSKRPWYMTKSFVLDRDCEDAGDEDPVRTPPANAEKKKRKTVEELRAERVQREGQERVKARKFMAAKAAATADFQRGTGGSRYHQSYGNAR